MSMLNRLLQQLKDRGLSVGPGNGPDELILFGPTKERTPEIMKALKAFRPQLLEKFGKREQKPSTPTEPAKATESCSECGRDASDPEDRARLSDPLYCEKGRSACPYKRG